MFPLLQFAKDGNEYSVENAEKYLAKYFDLSEKERKKPKLSGSEPLFLNRLRWARLFLKKAGLVIDPKISYYQITAKGKQVLEEDVEKLNVKYLLKYNEFKKWHNKKRIKKIERKPKHWKPVRETRNFIECSPDLKKALCILEKVHLRRREQILKDIKNAERNKKKSKTKNETNDADLELKRLLDNYSIEYDDWDATIALAFAKIDEGYRKKYQECANKESFFQLLGTPENPERFSHYIELGLDVEPFYDAIKNMVLANGQLAYNFEEHSALMKFYVNYLPNSQVTKQSIEFWLTNWKEYGKSKYATMSPLAFGLEALLDYDSNKYEEQIQEHVEFILSHQDGDGSFKLRDSIWNVEDSSNCIIALSKILESNHKSLIQGGAYLRNVLNKKQDGMRHFGELCLALIALGDGPKIPKAWLDNEKMKTERFLRQKTTQFVETSPNLNKQKIFQTIIQMIGEASDEILIIPPFIDMYSFLADNAQKNKKLKIKILSKPLNEFKGDRKRFAKAALDTLRTIPNVEIRISAIIHSRIIITDSKKIIGVIS